MISENKPVTLVSADEQARINRFVLMKINDYPELPVELVRYEELPADGLGMALSVIQGAFVTRRYILGGYEAEYQYKIIYRIKPGSSMDKRLKADEFLDTLADWLCRNWPTVDGARVRNVENTSRSSLFAQYENGDEDHQILMKMTYEVNV